MKSSLPPTAIHKRLYNVLPRTATSITPLQRPRSNSASLHTNSSLLPLTFFDTPPPPSSRLPPPQPPRIPPETKPHNSHSNTNPNPYALTPSRPSNHDSLQLLTASLPYGYQPSTHFNSPHLDHPHNAQSLQPRQKRGRHRYHLDVGAYGIPKRSRHSHRAFTSQASVDNSHLSVQIGEDAYFVRDNAMGVADGVGGWARSSSSSGLPCGATDHSGLTPSALFARRLMHFTSEQLEEADFGEPVEDLDSHLEDLADGIDVLQILERAYDQTVKAHVAPETKAPLHTGSSTALVAVLDHAAPVEHDPERDADVSEEEPEAVLKIAHVGDCMGMLVRGDEIVWRSEEMWWAWNTPVQLTPPRPSSTVASSESSRSIPPPSTLASLIASTSNFLSNPLFPSKTSTHQPFDPPPAPACDASGSSFTASTPLDKTTPTPRNSAQVLTVPVRSDDILILASDGLSDNLWDEDILDEVVRFKKLYDAGAASRAEVGGASITTRTEIRNGAIVASTSTSDGTFASTLTDSPSSQSSATPIQGPSYSMPSTLQRHTLAAMLSEALCSRAQHTSERRSCGLRSCHTWVGESRSLPTSADDDETPFSRRAKEVGKSFEGGKRDDISVLVAIVAPTQFTSNIG